VGSNLLVANEGAGTIGEYTTTGATVDPALVTGLSSPLDIAVKPTIVGDVNYDGVVNGLDIGLVASQWLQKGKVLADANGDGVVNGLDFSVISSNWLATSAGGSGATAPEPATIVLALVGAIALLTYRR
jgi:hypothetical protein